MKNSDVFNAIELILMVCGHPIDFPVSRVPVWDLSVVLGCTLIGHR